jgi:hypothetical protein
MMMLLFSAIETKEAVSKEAASFFYDQYQDLYFVKNFILII